MHHPSRPPSRPHGSTAAATTRGGGGDPAAPADASGVATRTPRSNGGCERSPGRPGSSGGAEPASPSRCGSKRMSPPFDGLGVFQTRSIFHVPRRASSGYFSSDGDSLSSPPLSPRPLTADVATQTPSPAGQVMRHALQRVAEAHGGGPRQHGPSPGSPSMWPPNAAQDMQAEAIGRELRRIGDDFNRQLLFRGMPGRHRRFVIRPNLLPHIHQEPAMLLCVSLLLLLIGRIIYLQGNMNSQDHAQV